MILLIGDDMVDLYPNANVFYTVQRVNIGNLSGRSVSYTNNFNAPWTENNERLFGFARDERSSDTSMYQLRQCKIINGIEVAQENVLYITKSDQRDFTIQVYENIFDYFLAVNDKVLGEFEPIVASGWEASDIDTARLNTSGIISALIKWGNDNVYNEDFFLPSFFYHSLLSAILEYTGLTVSGNILTDPRFTDLIVPYPRDNFEYPESYYSQFYDIDITGTHPVTGLHDPNTEYVVGLNPNHHGHGTFYARVPIGGIDWDASEELRLRLYKNFVMVHEVVIGTGPVAPGLIGELEYVDFTSPGDDYDIFMYSSAPGSPGTDFTIVDGSYLKFVPDGVVDRELVEWNQLFPEIKANDLLKDFFNRFAIIPKQTGSELILKTLQEIIADVPGAIDWSSKLVNVNKKSQEFKNEYAQNNKFYYNDLTSDKELGAGTMTVDSNVLPLAKTIYTSIFGNTKTAQFSSYFMAYIPVYDTDSTGIADFKQEPKLRLLTLKDQTEENPVTFDATPRSDYKLGYFVDGALTKDTSFQYFVDQFYPSLEEALQRNKIITKYYDLKDSDVHNFDVHKMMYDGDGYYLVNKIVNYKDGRITKVELFKLM